MSLSKVTIFITFCEYQNQKTEAKTLNTQKMKAKGRKKRELEMGAPQVFMLKQRLMGFVCVGCGVFERELKQGRE